MGQINQKMVKQHRDIYIDNSLPINDDNKHYLQELIGKRLDINVSNKFSDFTRTRNSTTKWVYGNSLIMIFSEILNHDIKLNTLSTYGCEPIIQDNITGIVKLINFTINTRVVPGLIWNGEENIYKITITLDNDEQYNISSRTQFRKFIGYDEKIQKIINNNKPCSINVTDLDYNY
jgi:hypothetical protein